MRLVKQTSSLQEPNDRLDAQLRDHTEKLLSQTSLYKQKAARMYHILMCEFAPGFSARRRDDLTSLPI